jgi:hypothetical protein
MKPTNFLKRALQAGLDAQRAWNLWSVQRGPVLLTREPESRLCRAARELAEKRSLEAAFFFALDKVFPFGLGGLHS